jgi:hypothetical protein
MSTTDKIALLSATAAWVQALLLIATVLFLFHQTATANKGVSEALKSTRVLAMNSTAESLDGLNRLLIEHEDLCQMFGYTRSEAMAHCLLNRFDQLYALSREGLLKPDHAQSLEEWVRLEMSKPVLLAAWRDARSLFDRDFGAWLDTLTGTGAVAEGR